MSGNRQIIELFELPSFLGMELPLSESVPDLLDFGVIGSLRVDSGIWEVFTEVGFQGLSIVIQPGSAYPDINKMINQTSPKGQFLTLKGQFLTQEIGISSVKLLKGEIILYENSGFRGKSQPLTESTPNLMDFNDRAMSARIISGTWELYENVDFQGASIVRSAGLPSLSLTVSSVRYIPPAD